MGPSALENLNGVVSRLKPRYSGREVAVTGGASFIGSHLVDALIDMGSLVTVIDDLSSGRESQINAKAKFIKADLRYPDNCQSSLGDKEIVFHLAAVHGGRGFIESQEAQMTANFAIDQNVFSSSSNCEMLVHASSACAYPLSLQAQEFGRGLLEETSAGFDSHDGTYPDGVYGWTKLIGELQLEKLAGTPIGPNRGRSARIFTAYGPRENESHAAIALIAKSLLRMDPFEIWGTGEQTRNFTYVSDTVGGLLELGVDTSPVKFDVYNVGTSVHSTVNEFVDCIWANLNWKPEIVKRDTTKPTGVGNRASDNSKFKAAFGWEPSITIIEGLSHTIDWYKSLPSRPKSLAELEKKLMSR